MKKSLTLILSVSLLVLLLGFTSAVPIQQVTYVSGKVYDSDHFTGISNATVEVTCNGNVEIASTNTDGSYFVSYLSETCPIGERVDVVAYSKDNKYGSDFGYVENFGSTFGVEVDFAVVNVTVPEFTLLVGALTALLGVGVFFFVKRE